MPPLSAHLKLLAKILMAGAILAVLGWRMNWTAIHEIIRDIRPKYFIAALLLMSVQVLLLSLRWYYLMNAEEKLVSPKTALNISVASQLANFMFITSVGGIILRLFLARHYGMATLKSVCAVVADRIMSTSAMFLFAILFLPVIASMLPRTVLDSSLIVFFVVIPLGLISAYIGLKILLPWIRKKESIFSSLLYLRELLRKPNIALPIVFSSLVAQGSFYLAGCMAAKAIGLDFNFLEYFALLPLISIVSSLPIGFGGWGIREGAFVVGLKLIHIPMESAFLISVQVGILSILGTLLIALPLILSGDLPKIFRLSGKLA